MKQHTCSCHSLPLAGGPVLWWCPETGSSVYAADIPTERPAGVTR